MADFTVPGALAASVALVVTGLATVGATGDGLTRAVRNHPWWMSILVSAALAAGLALVIIARSASAAAGPKWYETTFLTVLVVAAVAGVIVGAASISARESPAVSLTLTTASDETTLTVEAKSNDQRTNEQMIVQVLGLRTNAIGSPGESKICAPKSETDLASDLAAQRATILLWERVGPDLAGTRETSTDIVVPAGAYKAFCAAVVMPNRKVERNSATSFILAPPKVVASPSASPALGKPKSVKK